jgi:DNA-binding transcriptional LysR family regulator
VLVRSRRQLWVAPGHALAKIASPSFKDIAQHPYIMVTADEAELSTLGYWKSRRIKPNIVFRTTSIEAVRGLVAHGFGVTVLSDMVFRPWSLEGKRIEARPILDLVPPMEVGALWNPEKEISTPAEAFQQFLLHAYGY